ncbi:MAG: hypothetical protein ACN0LA_11140 [Candidatus Longimicrobiales bacterium M2_2A_002]
MSVRAGRLGAIAVLAMLALLGSGDAAAQGQSGSARDRVRVNLSQRTLAFGTPRYIDFDAGYIEAAGMVVSVRPRRNQSGPWELRIQSETPDMGGYGKPVGDILWRRAGSTTWNPLATTSQVILQGTGPREVTLFFRLRLDYALDPPDSYSADMAVFARTL